MKTERRHDLETNELASRMARWIDQLKPYLGQITIAALAVVALFAANSAWQSYSSSRQESSWDAFALASYTTDQEMMSLRRVAEDEEYEGTRMQEWAYITWADRQLLLASHAFLITRDAAEDRLRQVSGIYEQLAASSSDSQIRNRARFGLARVYEMQNKTDKAREQYELVQGDLQPLASERSQQLETEKVQEAVAWLASAELPRRDVTGGSGATGNRPKFDIQLPNSTPGAPTPDNRSLEEILGLAEEQAVEDDRYEEEPSSEDEAESAPEPQDDAPAEP